MRPRSRTVRLAGTKQPGGHPRDCQSSARLTFTQKQGKKEAKLKICFLAWSRLPENAKDSDGTPIPPSSASGEASEALQKPRSGALCEADS